MTMITGTCAPWAGVKDLCGPCITGGIVPDAPTFQAASDILFELSGRQFPGLCTTTVRPTTRWTGDRWLNGSNAQERWASGSFNYAAWGGNLYPWWSGWGLCNCGEERVGGSTVNSITLGYVPLMSVSAVKINGAVIDPSEYEIHDYRYLARLADANGNPRGWPCCQRLDKPDTESETFSVALTYGKSPPALGVRAAAELACELALACSPGDGGCRLPDRVTQITREGITQIVLDPLSFFQNGQVGLYTCDLFISGYNPDRLRRRASVFSPDTMKPSRRVTS